MLDFADQLEHLLTQFLRDISDILRQVPHHQRVPVSAGDRHLLTEVHAGAAGWFLVCDLDYFKHINDKYGHSVGDEVLKQFAEHLQNTFRFCGFVGRIGGDEFAVMLDIDLSQDQLEHLLTQFLRDISGILEQVTVSCSIGAYRFVFPQEIKHLLTETDRVLYQAKANGRACFVMEDSTEK